MQSKFRKPDRSDYTPNFTKTAENDALDIGWGEGVLSDGRAYRVEAWAQDQVTSVSIFLPTAGIENMSNDQFVDLLEREELIAWEPGARKSAYARPLMDSSGAPIWSVNVVIGADDQLFANDAFRLLPYAALEPNSQSSPPASEMTPQVGDEGEQEISDDELDTRSDSDELSEFAEEPDALTGWGYAVQEEETTSTVRWVRYAKSIESFQSRIRLTIGIEFELCISDEPTLSHWQALSYSFNGVRLEVFALQEMAENDAESDEETSSSREVGHSYLALTTLREVEKLVALLKFDADFFS
jgi:hypothetical protein